MSPSTVGGAFKRVLRLCARALVRAGRAVFFLGLVLIPIPIAVFPRPGRRDRRNLPAEILKEKR